MSRTGFIYKLVCRDLEVEECYIGSTSNFKCRKSKHKYACVNAIHKDHHFYVYQFILNHGGWDNWDMIQLEECEFNNKRELHARERHWIETLRATLNQTIPTRTQAEWRIQHKDKISIRGKEYYNQNKDKITINTKQRMVS